MKPFCLINFSILLIGIFSIKSHSQIFNVLDTVIRDNNVETVIHTNESTQIRTTYYYDRQGYLQKIVHVHLPNMQTSVNYYTWNSDLTLREVSFEGKSLRVTDKYFYDDQKKITKEVTEARQSDSSTAQSEILYFYDSSAKEIERQKFMNGKLYQTIKLVYKNNGSLVVQNEFNAEGELKTKIEETYNSNNKITKKVTTYYYPTKTVTLQTTKYDEKGRVVYFSSATGKRKSEFRYTYTPEGLLLTQNVDLKNNGDFLYMADSDLEYSYTYYK